MTDTQTRGIADRLSVLVLTTALCSVMVIYMRAQIQSQDTFNGRVTATLEAHDKRFDAQEKRLDRVESVVNWAAGGLVANLIAHIIQISTQMRKRREDDEGRPRIQVT